MYVPREGKAIPHWYTLRIGGEYRIDTLHIPGSDPRKPLGATPLLTNSRGTWVVFGLRLLTAHAGSVSERVMPYMRRTRCLLCMQAKWPRGFPPPSRQVLSEHTSTFSNLAAHGDGHIIIMAWHGMVYCMYVSPDKDGVPTTHSPDHSHLQAKVGSIWLVRWRHCVIGRWI